MTTALQKLLEEKEAEERSKQEESETPEEPTTRGDIISDERFVEYGNFIFRPSDVRGIQRLPRYDNNKERMTANVDLFFEGFSLTLDDPLIYDYLKDILKPEKIPTSPPDKPE